MSFDKDGFEVKGTKHRIHIACKNGDIKAVKEHTFRWRRSRSQYSGEIRKW